MATAVGETNRPPLRVLGVISGFEVNGANIQLYQCLERIDRTRVDFTLCSLTHEGALFPRFQDLGLPIHVCRRSFRLDLFVLFRIARIMRRGSYDVIYTMKHTGAFWGRAAASLSGTTPTVTHEAGYPLPFAGWFTTLLDRIQSRGSRLILANSHYTKDLVVKHLGVARDRIHVLYNGLAEDGDTVREGDALSRIQEFKRQTHSPVLGFVGRLTGEKGCDLFLRALPGVFGRHPGYGAVVCGDGVLRTELEALTRDLGIGDRVLFSGWTQAPIRVMREFDLLVIPSLYESFCLTLLEAALAEVPVVAADVGAISEINNEIDIGTLVRPRIPVEGVGSWAPMAGNRRLTPHVDLKGLLALDPRDLTDRVGELLGDPEERAKLVSGARNRALRGFSIDSHVRQFEDELCDVIQSQ